MMRTVNIILVALMLAGAGVVYFLKFEAERVTGRITKLHQKIDQEKSAIASLKAEWSLLNQPKRLQELTERYHTYLDLDPLDPTQIGTIDDIPFRLAVPPDSGKSPDKMLAGGKLVDHTGSIPKPGDKTAKKPGDLPVLKTVEPRANDPLLTILR